MNLLRRTMQSPIGDLHLVGDECGLARIGFAEHDVAGLAPATGYALVEAQRQLEQYFAGERTAFDVALAPLGTEFERAVWERVAAIPYGATASYGEIARAIGDVGHSRAVGAANGANPLPVIVPCHRVIGANGKLTGYAGGLERKRTLLGLEAGGVQQSLLATA